MARRKQLSEVELDFAEHQPQNEPRDFRFLQGLYRMDKKQSDEELWLDFLTNALKKDYVEADGHIWFKFGNRWTYCIARPHRDERFADNDRYVDFHRAIF